MVTRSTSFLPSQQQQPQLTPCVFFSPAMAAYYKMGQDSPSYPAVNFDQVSEDTYIGGVLVNEHVDVQGNHRSLIREIGGASTVLLKNTKSVLPLSASAFRRWGIFGSDAGPNPDGPNGCSDRGCDQGTLAMGWGSGTANFPYVLSLFYEVGDLAADNPLLVTSWTRYRPCRPTSTPSTGTPSSKEF